MAAASDAGRHVSGTCTRLVIEHVEKVLGGEAIHKLVTAIGDGITLDDLVDDAHWFSYDQFRRYLEEAARLLGDVERLSDIADCSVTGGTMPEATAMLQAFGSPSAMLAAMSDGQSGIVSISGGTTRQLGPTSWEMSHWFHDGFDAYPEYCAFMRGMSPLGPALFGLRKIDVREVRCMLRGDADCAHVMTWDESEDLGNQLEFTKMSLELSTRSLDAFHQTIADLVATADIDTVLDTVISRASRNSRSPGFVLALEPVPWTHRHVYSVGVDDDEAATIAAEAAAGRGENYGFCADVASNRLHYGWLVAINNGTMIDAERHSLQAYARLAATALDSACALDDARRQTAIAHALLALATDLTRTTTAEEIAAKVAFAIPNVLRCDASAVVLVHDGIAEVAASSNLNAAALASIKGGRKVESGRGDALRITDIAGADANLATLMRDHGVTAIANAPIDVDGEIAGYLVAMTYERPERLLDNPDVAERFAGLAGQTAVALSNVRLVDQIRHQALHDALTDLPNRALILDRAEQMLLRSHRTRSASAALFIDLDGFKEVNDTLGHAAGDHLLRSVAARLQTAVRSSDTVGRLGGDEFVVLSEGASLDAGPEVVAERLLDVLRAPFEIPGHSASITCTASVGIAVGDRHTAGELLRDADIALYHAKSSGKNCYSLFAPEMQADVRNRALLLDGLGDALPNDQYFLVYQPVFDIQAEKITGVEALLRWQHPSEGVVAPDLFIPLLEETGLIVEVGRWVLHEACRQTAEWHAAGHAIDVSVNASARQFERGNFVNDVRSALDASGLPASCLVIEITETAIMRDAEATSKMLLELKKLGVRIAIDDFGTGYSSLAYLRQFPVDALKIDRSFISAIADTPAAGELIHTLVQLGKALSLETFAEGIESRDQFERLQHEGCDSGQGFMFARPLEPTSLRAFLDEHHVSETAVL